MFAESYNETDLAVFCIENPLLVIAVWWTYGQISQRFIGSVPPDLQ